MLSAWPNALFLLTVGGMGTRLPTHVRRQVRQRSDGGTDRGGILSLRNLAERLDLACRAIRQSNR